MSAPAGRPLRRGKAFDWAEAAGSVALWAAALLFLSMLCMPRSYSEYKVPLVLFAVAVVLIEIFWSGRLNYHPRVFWWLTAFLAFGVFWAFLGSLRVNPGVADHFRLGVLWVVLYALFISGVSGKRSMNLVLKMVVLAGVAISFYNIAFILKTIGLIPDHPLFHLEMGAKIGIHSGYIQLTAHNIGTLAFVTPFLFALLVFSEEETILGIRRRNVFLVLLITVATVIFSGRRILWLNILITPLVCYALSLFVRSGSRAWNRKLLYTTVSLLGMGTLLFAYLSIWTEWSSEDFVRRITSLLEEEDRFLQIAALNEGFAENPIFGSGFGRGVPEVVRSLEKTWVYEMSYNIMLYNVGLVGMAVYLGCIGWVYRAGLRLAGDRPAERAIMLSLLVGMTNFLLANATNPYFGSYDFMWTLFLPVAYVNYAMLNAPAPNG